jgi:tetratricopeptide (TPR) repeat protein
MFKKLTKQLLGKKKPEYNAGEKLGLSLREKSKELPALVRDKFDLVQKEILLIREKFKNLRETNYDLGLKHLENGRLVDAILRFRIIKIIWPEFLDAHYQLAYCLALKNKFKPAEIILEKLLEKDPDNNYGARELLNHIEKSMQSELSGE